MQIRPGPFYCLQLSAKLADLRDGLRAAESTRFCAFSRATLVLFGLLLRQMRSWRNILLLRVFLGRNSPKSRQNTRF